MPLLCYFNAVKIDYFDVAFALVNDAKKVASLKYNSPILPKIPSAAPIVPETVPLIFDTPIRLSVVTGISLYFILA